MRLRFRHARDILPCLPAQAEVQVQVQVRILATGADRTSLSFHFPCLLAGFVVCCLSVYHLTTSRSVGTSSAQTEWRSGKPIRRPTDNNGGSAHSHDWLARLDNVNKTFTARDGWPRPPRPASAPLTRAPLDASVVNTQMGKKKSHFFYSDAVYRSNSPQPNARQCVMDRSPTPQTPNMLTAALCCYLRGSGGGFYFVVEIFAVSCPPFLYFLLAWLAGWLASAQGSGPARPRLETPPRPPPGLQGLASLRRRRPSPCPTGEAA